MMMTAARMPRFGSKRVLAGEIYVYLIAAAGNAAHIAAAVTTVPRVFATASAVTTVPRVFATAAAVAAVLRVTAAVVAAVLRVTAAVVTAARLAKQIFDCAVYRVDKIATAVTAAAPATVTTTAGRTGTAAGITRITHKITSVVKIYGARERTPYCILCVYF